MDISLIATIFLTVLQAVTAVRHTVYWDREKIPQLGEGGLKITLEVDDWMDVLCPYASDYDDILSDKDDNDVYLQIYNVTEDEYINCDTTHGIRLQSCDDPMIEKKLTTKFQERSPYPFGFTFRAGSTYYYVSKPLYDKSRGCTRNTMKMAINVRRKGSVFSEEERHVTKTYHIKEHESTRQKGLKSNPKSESPDKPRRHNHHTRATTKSPSSTRAHPTRRPQSPGNSRVRASQHSTPGNKASRTLASLTIAFTAVLISFLSDFITSGLAK